MAAGPVGGGLSRSLCERGPVGMAGRPSIDLFCPVVMALAVLALFDEETEDLDRASLRFCSAISRSRFSRAIFSRCALVKNFGFAAASSAAFFLAKISSMLRGWALGFVDAAQPFFFSIWRAGSDGSVAADDGGGGGGRTSTGGGGASTGGGGGGGASSMMWWTRRRGEAAVECALL